MKRILFCIALVLFLFCLPAFSQESLTITTYYPAPFGVYQELRSRRIAIGNAYHTSAYCWPPEACANRFDANASLLVEGNVGVGTLDPQANLEVNNTIRLSPTTAPASSMEGTFYYNSNQHRFLYRSNTGWVAFGGGYSERTKVESRNCWWGGTHTLDAQCPAGYVLIGCAGGPGDQDQNNEGYYIDPDLVNNYCRGYFKEPHCGAWDIRQQRVTAICAK